MASPPDRGFPVVIDFAIKHEFRRGRRSRLDAEPWHCECGFVNVPEECLLFDIPAFACRQCGKKFDGDIDFSLSEITVNSILPVPIEPYNQHRKPECLAYAMANQLHIMYMLSCAFNDEIPNPEFSLDPDELVDCFNNAYPNVSSIAPGVHKKLRMAQILRNTGLKSKDGSVCKVRQMTCVAGDNYEGICRELANGYPLLATYLSGDELVNLEFCQMYHPPLYLDKHKSDKASPLHEVVIIGVKSIGGVKGFYFLNSSGNILWARFEPELPCIGIIAQVFKDCVRIMPKLVSVGVGKITEYGLLVNLVKFCRGNDITETDTCLFDETVGSGDISQWNFDLLVGTHFDKQLDLEIAKDKEMAKGKKIAKDKEIAKDEAAHGGGSYAEGSGSRQDREQAP